MNAECAVACRFKGFSDEKCQVGGRGLFSECCVVAAVIVLDAMH